MKTKSANFPIVEVLSRETNPSARLDHKNVQNLRNYNLTEETRPFKAIVAPPGSAGAGDFTDIQVAVNYVDGEGGGVVLLRAGTYTLTANLTLPTGISLIGESFGTAVLVFAGPYGITATGTSAYSTGTIAVTRGSTSVVGTGTSWLANLTTSHKIKIDGIPYSIASVDTNTTLTLSSKQFGQTQSGLAYLAAVFVERVKIENLVVVSAASTGITLTYTDLILINSTILSGCATSGIIVTNSARFTAELLVIDGSGSTGATFTNTDLINCTRMLCTNSTSHGVSMTDCNSVVFTSSPSNANGGSGFNVSGSSKILWLSCDGSENTSYGISMAGATTQTVVQGGSYSRNVDGIRLAGTVSKCTICAGMIATGNSAYGVNVTVAGVDRTTISTNQLTGNTTAAINDAGTLTNNSNNQT